jgi:lauroyl/myristoyl acyltransferase
MERFLYLAARGGIALLQCLPLRWVARLGRCGGAVAYLVDARHRRVAMANLNLCFSGEITSSQIRALAREHFRRIGEGFACAIKTAAMAPNELEPHLRFLPPRPWTSDKSPERLLVAIGHFGNFELYARMRPVFPNMNLASTYRALPQVSLNRLLENIRNASGTNFFERRSGGTALRAFMGQPRVVLGLLADQNAGVTGLRLPFLGHECSTSPAPAVFALRYDCSLVTSICYRTGLAQWQIELGPEIPTHENGHPRSPEAIMADVNRAFEVAVRRDPANWFWVHNRWKARRFRGKQRARSKQPGAEDSDHL